MTKSENTPGPEHADQTTLETLLEQVPSEFKHLADEFERQTRFYQQLLKDAANHGPINLQTGAWSIPTSHGFSGHDRPDLENPWFEPLFKLSKNDDPFGFHMVQQWSQELQSFTLKAQQEILAFQSASQHLSTLHQRVGENAQAFFQAKLADIDQDDPDQMCQAWLSAGEHAFQEISQSDEFLENQAALFNALSRLKTLQSELANRFSTTFGLPDQNELGALRQGLHDLRMEFADYREHTAQEIRKLREQLKKPAVRSKRASKTK